MKKGNPRRGFFFYTWKGAKLVLKGVFRGLRVVFLLVFILLIGGYFVVQKVFDEERVKAILVTQLQDVLRRPVQIDRVIITPHGMKLRGVRIRETSDPTQTLLYSETAIVTVKLRPLLDRRLELGHVRLIDPSIHVTRDQKGGWNFADIFASTRSARPAGGRFSLPVSLAADLTTIEGGVLKVDDLHKGRSYHFDKLNLSVEQFDVDRPFPLTASFNSVATINGKTIEGAVALEGSMSLASFDWPSAYLRAAKLKAVIDGNVLRGTGALTGLPEAAIELAFTVPALSAAQIQKYFTARIDWDFPASLWKARLALDGPRQVEFKQVQVSAPPLSASGTGLLDLRGSTATLRAVVTIDRFPLEQAASIRPAWGKHKLAGTIAGTLAYSGPLSRLKLDSASLRASSLVASFAKWRIDGGFLAASVSNELSDLKVEFSSGQVSAYNGVLKDISLSLTLIKGDLKVSNLAGRWIDSNVKLKARILNVSNPKEVAITGTIDRLRWEEAQQFVYAVFPKLSSGTVRTAAQEAEDDSKPWLRIFKYVIPKRFPDTVGHITIGSVAHRNATFNNTDAVWEIRGVTPSLDRLTGDLKLGFGPGRVTDIPAVQESNKFLRIVFLPFIYMHKMNNLSVFSTKTAYPQTLDFNRIEGEYGLQGGVATTRCFYVDSPQIVAFADGTADLGKETVDMKILTRLTSYRDPLPEWLVDERNRPALAVWVRNDLQQASIWSRACARWPPMRSRRAWRSASPNRSCASPPWRI